LKVTGGCSRSGTRCAAARLAKISPHRRVVHVLVGVDVRGSAPGQLDEPVVLPPQLGAAALRILEDESLRLVREVHV
jgi:hypothetical protein